MTPAVAHLRLVDGNGELIDESDDPQETIKALQRALVKQDKEIKALRADKVRERKSYARRTEVEEIINEWRVLSGHKASRITPDRFDAVRTMLDAEYTREHFLFVNLGLREFPFSVYGERRASGKTRKDDIAYVCAKGERFEEAANLGARWLRERGVVGDRRMAQEAAA